MDFRAGQMLNTIQKHDHRTDTIAFLFTLTLALDRLKKPETKKYRLYQTQVMQMTW